ncbi:MAG TPA: DUF5320 domain-containing protein [Clostridiaceae bacterium]|nr:DUF5320 domain-containing protein [Clostridiaceae bacterium]
MPRRDKTGPMGLGSMTGRGLGSCSGKEAEERETGLGMGRGLGRGRRFGRRFGRAGGRGFGRGFGMNRDST